MGPQGKRMSTESVCHEAPECESKKKQKTTQKLQKQTGVEHKNK